MQDERLGDCPLDVVPDRPGVARGQRPHRVEEIRLVRHAWAWDDPPAMSVPVQDEGRSSRVAGDGLANGPDVVRGGASYREDLVRARSDVRTRNHLPGLAVPVLYECAPGRAVVIAANRPHVGR